MGLAKPCVETEEGDEARAAAISALRHRYVREKQQAMRYRQHAMRISSPDFAAVLAGMAAEEEKHAELIASKTRSMGEEPPDVIPIRVAREQNTWSYLRTDLEEEQRCAGELKDDLPSVLSTFPDIAELLERIERDSERHRAQLFAMLAHTDPQSAGPA